MIVLSSKVRHIDIYIQNPFFRIDKFVHPTHNSINPWTICPDHHYRRHAVHHHIAKDVAILLLITVPMPIRCAYLFIHNIIHTQINVFIYCFNLMELPCQHLEWNTQVTSEQTYTQTLTHIFIFQQDQLRCRTHSFHENGKNCFILSSNQFLNIYTLWKWVLTPLCVRFAPWCVWQSRNVFKRWTICGDFLSFYWKQKLPQFYGNAYKTHSTIHSKRRREWKCGLIEMKIAWKTCVLKLEFFAASTKAWLTLILCSYTNRISFAPFQA